jgi:hypothetical protein
MKGAKYRIPLKEINKTVKHKGRLRYYGAPWPLNVID